MTIRNQTRRDPGQNIRRQTVNVTGGNIFSPSIRPNRFAGTGAMMAARGAQEASQALDTYLREKKVENTKEGVAMAMKNEALPENATPEMAEAWYGTRGQNDGNRMQNTLTNYLIENPDATYDEYASYAKGQFNASIQDQPDAYAIQYGSKAIPIMQENLLAFKVKKEGEKRTAYLTDTMTKFKDDVMQVQRFTDKSQQAPVLRNLITGMQRNLKAWGFDRTRIGMEAVRVIESQAMETEDTSLFEVFDVRDQDGANGVRLIDNRTIGLQIIAAEERVEAHIKAEKQEARQKLVREQQDNFSSTLDLVATGSYREALSNMKDLDFKLRGEDRIRINELVENEISQNRNINEAHTLDRELNQEIAMMTASGDLGDYTPMEIMELRRMKKIDMQTAVNALKFLGDDSQTPQKKFFNEPEVIQIMSPPGMENILMAPANAEGDAVSDATTGSRAKQQSYSCLKLYQDDVRSWVAQFNTGNNRMPNVGELRDYAQRRESYWQKVGFLSTDNKDQMKTFYQKILSYVKEGKPAPENLLQGFGTFMGNSDMTMDEFLDFGEELTMFQQNYEAYTPPEPKTTKEPDKGPEGETQDAPDPVQDVWKTRLKEVIKPGHPWRSAAESPVNGPTMEQMAANPFFQGLEKIQDQVHQDFTRTIGGIAETYDLSPIGAAARGLQRLMAEAKANRGPINYNAELEKIASAIGIDNELVKAVQDYIDGLDGFVDYERVKWKE